MPAIAEVGRYNSILYEYSEKIFDKSLSTSEIVDSCEEYFLEIQNKSVIGTLDGMHLSIYAHIDSFCWSNKLKFETKARSEFNFIKALDIERIPFALIRNNSFSILGSTPDIAKNPNCFINLNNEDDLWMDFFDITERCNISRFINTASYAVLNGDELHNGPYIYEYHGGSLVSNWIKIQDFYYGDINEDGFLDLIIELYEDGSYSAPGETSIVTITSFVDGKFQNIY